MSGDIDWRWADPSGQQRLLRTDELRAALASGTIAPNTPVWRAGWSEWRPASDVAELMTSALSAQNGVVPNIPPPPMAVVAVQRAYEGSTPRPATSGPIEEPPPPPRYVPAATRPQPGMFHTPSQPMRAPAAHAPVSVPAAHPVEPIKTTRDGPPPAPAPTPKPSPANRTIVGQPAIMQLPDDTNTAVRAIDPSAIGNLHTPHLIEVEPPTVRPTGEDSLGSMGGSARARTAPRAPAPPPKAGNLSALVRSPSSPPGRPSSKPPPPKPMSKPPPPVKHAEPEVIEELSGSVLLADASGSQRTDAIEELSGSILLSEPGTMQAITAPLPSAPASAPAAAPAPAPVSAPGRANAPGSGPRPFEDLSGSFLLDAGSTGALPSIESTGQILAAKAVAAAQRAPFGAYDAPEPGTPGVTDATHVPSVVIESPPAPVIERTVEPANVAPFPAPPVTEASGPHALAIGAPAPEAPRPPGGEVPAMATLVGVPPPPDVLAAMHALPPSAPQGTPAPSSSRARLSASEPVVPPPAPERSSARLHDIRSFSPDPRAKFLVPALGALGLLVALGIIGLVVGAVRKKPSEEAPPVATSVPIATATATTATTPATTPAPLGAIGGACSPSGAAHVIAPRAVVQSAVEAQTIGAHLALGFATSPRDGIAVAIDPTSLAATQTFHARAPDAIRRLVPVQGARGIGGAADVDRGSDPLAGRRTMSAQPPFDLGFGNGGLAWAPRKSNDLDVIWTLEGDAPVEAIRAAPLDPGHEDAGWAIAFRRGASIYAGAVSGGATLTPKGPLVKIDGLGPQVGSPTIAAQDGAVLVAWADRATPADAWALRWMRFAAGDASAQAKSFVPSEGGLGEHAMSPAIAAAGQGRFVLVWTEGPVANHQVRAQTINGSGAPIGTAMAISDSGVNAGQAQLAMLPDGHGVVAYLASSGAGPKAAYSVLATPIACP